jgi:ribokinase
LPEIFAIAAQKQLHIALNPSPFDSALLQLPLEQVKWWFCNEIEAAALFGDGSPEGMAQRFLARYPGSNLVLTLGSDGCLFCNAMTQLRLPACKVQPVDTTAAGDTFTGFFLAAIAAGKSEEGALRLATKAAAITVTRMGASVSIPYANEVQ